MNIFIKSVASSRNKVIFDWVAKQQSNKITHFGALIFRADFDWGARSALKYTSLIYLESL